MKSITKQNNQELEQAREIINLLSTRVRELETCNNNLIAYSLDLIKQLNGVKNEKHKANIYPVI